MKFARYEFAGAVRDGVRGPDDALHELAQGSDIDDLIKRGGRAALLAAGTSAALPAPRGPGGGRRAAAPAAAPGLDP